jgi:hypothetical protein
MVIVIRCPGLRRLFMGWIDAELALTAVAAMLSPTTLSFSVLALVLGHRPLRTGVWFYLGAFGVTLAVGVLAAFVLGNKAASSTSYPKPWVAVFDIAAALFLVFFIVRFLRRPRDPKRGAEPWGGHVAQAIMVLALAVGGIVLLARARPGAEARAPGDGVPSAAPTPRSSLRPVPLTAGSRK